MLSGLGDVANVCDFVDHVSPSSFPSDADDRFGHLGGHFNADGTMVSACSWSDDDVGTNSGSCYTFDSTSCNQMCKFMPDNVGVMDVHASV